VVQIQAVEPIDGGQLPHHRGRRIERFSRAQVRRLWR